MPLFLLSLKLQLIYFIFSFSAKNSLTGFIILSKSKKNPPNGIMPKGAPSYECLQIL
jgi:hypothetical protein